MRPDRPTSFPEARLSSDGVGGSSSVSPPRGKPKRKAIPAHVKVSVAIAQANIGTLSPGILCPLCRLTLFSFQKRVLEHMTPHATKVALGEDPDAIDNLAWVHDYCAHRKTNGTKATTAGSDKHAIAKGKRFDRVNAGLRSRERKGPPMKSRNTLSDPTLKRTFGGKVVPR